MRSVGETSGLDVPVARLPVPREFHSHDVCFPICSLCSPDHKRVGISDPELQGLARERWRGTGPRPTVRGRRFYRSAGPVPRVVQRQAVAF